MPMDVLCGFKIKIEQKLVSWVYQRPLNDQIQIKKPNNCQEPPASVEAPIQDTKYMDGLCTFKLKIWKIGVSKISDYNKSRSRCQTPSKSFIILQSSKSGLKGHGCSLHLQNQDGAKIWIISISKTSDHIQIKMPNPSQESPVSSRALSQDLKDMYILCTFNIKIESQNLEYWSMKDQ